MWTGGKRIAEEKAKKEAEEKAAAEAEAKRLAEEEAQKKANAQPIEYAQLKKNPDRYAGEYVKYTGQIIQILEDATSTEIRLAVTKESYGWNFNDIIYVVYEGLTDYVEDDVVTVYGEIHGSISYTSQAGWDITLPAMFAEEVTQ